MIKFEKFKKWAESRFEDILVKDKEIRINSIFTDDEHHHLWCSPSGGKNKRKWGVYHCFKTDKKGTLVKLVQLVDQCDRDEAISILQGELSIRELEKRLEELLGEEEQVYVPAPQLKLPDGCCLISDLPSNNWWRKKSEEYLAARKMPINELFICTEPPYKARIIIPYYNKHKELIYWNGRHIGNSKIRYLGPPKEVGVGKGDVVFMAGPWPKTGSIIHLCEGEFNAKSLFLSGLNGAACGGKNMGEKQSQILSEYKIVLCLDRDKPGWKGSMTMGEKLSAFQRGMDDKLLYVRPPVPYKDWNEMYIKEGPNIVRGYIEKYQKPIDYSAPAGMAGDVFSWQDL